MIIRIVQFELRSVHTGEVIAIFELRSVHTRDRIFDLEFQSRRRCMARVWVPCQSNMHKARISCASVHMQHAVYRWKWLERHVAPPLKSQFRGQGIHTAISLRDLRDASLENTWPSFELPNSIYASRCNFAYTWSKILSFEWSLKLRNLNDHSIAHLALVWQQSVSTKMIDNGEVLTSFFEFLSLSVCSLLSWSCEANTQPLLTSLRVWGWDMHIYHIKSYINQSLTGKPRSLNSNWCV